METVMRRGGGYGRDLAFIHDDGFSAFSLEAAKGLLTIFREHALPEKRVVELGCGSGRLARTLLHRGFTVIGVDASSAMISLARRNAPQGNFTVESIWSYAIPRCGAVIAVGEVINYQFDGMASAQRLERLFLEVYESLLPRGIFVFDILCERQSGKTIRSKMFAEGRDWLVAVEKVDSRRSVTRRILSFRRYRRAWRKSTEIHKVRRHNLNMVVGQLRAAGFKVSTQKGYSGKSLGESRVVVVVRKPNQHNDAL